jgi:hypothetical protein
MLMVCLFAGFGAKAQVTCSRELIAEARPINSADEYLRIQDSVQVLAYDLYLISEAFPNYKYVHQTNEAGKIVAVSVVGISDAEMATKAATNLMLLEVLGDQVRKIDPSLLPSNRFKGDEIVSEKEAARYKPAPPRMKEHKTIIVSSGI